MAKDVKVVRPHAEDCDGNVEPFDVAWWFPGVRERGDAAGRIGLRGWTTWEVLECNLGCNGKILVRVNYLLSAVGSAVEAARPSSGTRTVKDG